MQKPLFWGLRPGERRFILLTGDLLVTIVSLILAIFFWAQDDWLNISLQFIRERIPFWFYFLPLVWIVLLIELYEPRRANRIGDTVRGIGIAAGSSLGLYLVLFFVSSPGSLPRLGVAAFIVGATALTLIWRALYIKIFTAPLLMRRVLIIGAGNAGSTLAKIIQDIYPPPFFLAGFIDDDPNKRGDRIEDVPVLGGGEDLLRVVAEKNISDLVFAIAGDIHPALFRSLLEAEELGIEVTTMPRVYEELFGRVPILLLQSDWILRSFVDFAHSSEFSELNKRLLDIFGGLVGCLLFGLLYPFISFLIFLDSGLPLLYRQKRLGKNGKEYSIIKFRTMYTDAEKDGRARLASADDERITRVGRFLR
ncbi:MAG: sugar transferase, partial [Anaerolineaceae bacterium]|nr:sugar transferase [Anaerolineaceae bacterium]